ncbi:MAG: gliding motility-associated C-terminal domain-containing protein [Saprospiraceae bacterium]|nr:gliding motility-associated C-terminal domain-containing protein [Saprospiraceae bacterium]
MYCIHFRALLFLSLLAMPTVWLTASCADSVRFDISPASCYDQRDGRVRIDTVFGGEKPFYFSIDGQNFSTNPLFDRLKADEYIVYVRDASGCITSFFAQVEEPEELKVYLNVSDSTVVAGDVVTLRAEVTPEDAKLAEIIWRPPFLFDNPNNLLQTVKVNDTTTFAIIVTDSLGCTARAQVFVGVEQTQLYFPNALAPGSDNDGWFTVFSGEGVREIASLQVYNRGGGLVFERKNFATNDPLKGWNGRAKGKYVQAGVYSWLAIIEFLDGNKRHYEGTITVLPY